MAFLFAYFAAFAATAAGAGCLYLAAPRQQWLRRRLPSSFGLIGGGLLGLGWVVWSAILHPVAALFTSLTMVMALLTALPFVAVLSPHSRLTRRAQTGKVRP